MSAIADAAAALRAAVATVADVRVYDDPAATVDPPAAVLGPPSLAWQTGCPGPDEATWHVYVIVVADGRAMARLWDLVAPVAAAVDTVTGAVVTGAEPGVFNSGGTDLPSYDITVEMGI